jgi:hypothetical protein
MNKALLTLLLLISACATMSAANRLEQRFLSFGMEPRLASCLVGELDEDLSSREMKAVADFLDEFEDPEDRRPRAAFDAIMSMDNPDIVASLAAAGVSCAFRR